MMSELVAKVRAKPLKALPAAAAGMLVRRLRHGIRSVRFSVAHSFANNTRMINVRGLKIALGVSSETEHYRATTYATKEPETLDWLDTEFSANDVLFDIGANVGVYTLYAALKNPEGKVFAFEPESQNFSRLCQNLWANNLRNVTPCNFALSDKTEANFFFVSNRELGSSMHSFGRVSDYQSSRPVALKQGVFGCSLDELVSKYQFPFPTILKIDVDGLEPEILAGAMTLLADRRLRSVLVELGIPHPRFDEIIENFKKSGFELAKTSAWAYQDQGISMRNYIFKRPGATVAP